MGSINNKAARNKARRLEGLAHGNDSFCETNATPRHNVIKIESEPNFDPAYVARGGQRSPGGAGQGVAQPWRAWVGLACCGVDQARFLKRQDSFPVSMISQWWVRRSCSAVVIFGVAEDGE